MPVTITSGVASPAGVLVNPDGAELRGGSPLWLKSGTWAPAPLEARSRYTANCPTNGRPMVDTPSFAAADYAVKNSSALACSVPGAVRRTVITRLTRLDGSATNPGSNH